MDQYRLLELLQSVKLGELTPAQAAERMAVLPYKDLTFAKVDHHRALRKGFPEVILGETKTPEQLVLLVEELARNGGTVLVTRASEDGAGEVTRRFPRAQHNPLACTILLNRAEPVTGGHVLVVSAGTGDIAVAEEASVTVQAMGSRVDRIDDVGVAGLHRLLDQLDRLRRARVIVAVAGMDGVLPTVVAGLVAAPVIAVPTSVGYGTGVEGPLSYANDAQ